MNLESKLVQGLIGVAVLIALIYGAIVLLAKHDASLRAQWETEAKIEKLQTDNTRLETENKGLKDQIETIQQETANKVEAAQKERAAADTPDEEVAYIQNSVPGLHLHMTEESPEVTLPKAELPALADVIGEKKSLTIELDGTKQELELTRQQLQNATSEVANLKSENALLKKSKNGSKGAKFKWFVRGVAVGAGLAAFLL